MKPSSTTEEETVDECILMVPFTLLLKKKIYIYSCKGNLNAWPLKWKLLTTAGIGIGTSTGTGITGIGTVVDLCFQNVSHFSWFFPHLICHRSAKQWDDKWDKIQNWLIFI